MLIGMLLWLSWGFLLGYMTQYQKGNPLFSLIINLVAVLIGYGIASLIVGF